MPATSTPSAAPRDRRLHRQAIRGPKQLTTASMQRPFSPTTTPLPEPRRGAQATPPLLASRLLLCELFEKRTGAVYEKRTRAAWPSSRPALGKCSCSLRGCCCTALANRARSDAKPFCSASGTSSLDDGTPCWGQHGTARAAAGAPRTNRTAAVPDAAGEEAARALRRPVPTCGGAKYGEVFRARGVLTSATVAPGTRRPPAALQHVPADILNFQPASRVLTDAAAWHRCWAVGRHV
ncbi:unnamed protein product [Symbiodinium sp. CCMP2592]|nr:unnamed protein product [Symbiodinium sp. CCMP2592]